LAVRHRGEFGGARSLGVTRAASGPPSKAYFAIKYLLAFGRIARA
jgi:hypothetical protein